MNLVKFLLFGAIISTVLGAFGHYPFGAASTAVSVTDLLLSLCGLFYLIWKVIYEKRLLSFKLFNYQLIFLAVGLISLIFSTLILNWSEIVTGLLYLIRYALYTTTLLIAYDLKKQNILKVGELIKLFLIVGVVLTIFGFIQLIAYPNFVLLTDFGFDPHIGRLTSTLLDPNFMGVYLSFLIGLTIYQYFQTTKKVYPGLLLFFVVGLILTFSRSAYLMLTVFVLIVSLKKWRILLPILLIVGIISYLTLPRFSQRLQGVVMLDKTVTERIKSWQTGWDIFQHSPIIGIGFNNLRSYQLKNSLIRVESNDGGASGNGVDSGIVFVLATTGILGILGYMIFWFGVLGRLDKDSSNLRVVVFGLAVAWLVNGQFINSLFYPGLMLWYFTLLGATYD